MLLALLFVIVVIGAGLAALRVTGLAKGALTVELAPGLGLAAVSVLATWSIALGLPPPLPGLLVLAVALAGLASTLIEHDAVLAMRSIATSVRRPQRVPALVGAAALTVPLVMIAVPFGGIEAPLSTHDGAFHVEVVNSLRGGGGLGGWYPPGLEASFAALLQALPWRDSAQGSYELGLGLSLLAPMAVFGLCLAVWRDFTIAVLAALLAALTYLFGYYTQIWSGWPLQMANLMLLGVWALALEYLERPRWQWAVAGGVLFGGIVVTHGSELISAAIILLVLLLSRYREISWRRLGLDLPTVVAVGAVCAVPYLPTLLGWAAGGGASAVGYAEAGALDAAAQSAGGGEALRVFALVAIGIDLPVRIVLICAGVAWIIRQRSGRHVLVVAGMFSGLGIAFAFLSGVPIVRLVYAVTYPWGLTYRLFLVVAAVLAMVAAVGGVRIATWLRAWFATSSLKERLARAGRVAVVTWLVLSTWAMVVFVSIPVGVVSSYSADDAAAMAWLRANAAPRSVVVNDGFADAGIWAPYKAGVRILEYRSVADPNTATQRDLVQASVGQLDQNPDAMAAACALNVRYVYYGAKNTAWQARSFPPLAELEKSTALAEVFRSGDAAVLETLLACPS